MNELFFVGGLILGAIGFTAPANTHTETVVGSVICVIGGIMVAVGLAG